MMSSSFKQLSRRLVDAVFVHSGTAVQRKNEIARSIKINAKQLIACERERPPVCRGSQLLFTFNFLDKCLYHLILYQQHLYRRHSLLNQMRQHILYQGRGVGGWVCGGRGCGRLKKVNKRGPGVHILTKYAQNYL